MKSFSVDTNIAEIDGSFYKIGLYGKPFRYSTLANEWMRSSKPVSEIQMALEIKQRKMHYGTILGA